eukprot:PITA_17741
MASLSFMLELSSLACLLFVADNNAFGSASSSEEETNQNFQLHSMSNTFREKVSTVDGTPHEEWAAEMIDRGQNLSHPILNKRVAGECNIFSGMWVHDASYPLYSAGQCPYLTELSAGSANCRKNGRPDSDYEKWRWQPRGCSIPRFNATDMLWRLRRKRLMFVGDSISRSQWESMVCILQAVIPSNRETMIYRTSLTIFKALDYKASVEFLWAPFLVQQSITREKKRILRLDSVGKNGVYWKGVDVLVFETSHWWHQIKGVSWDSMMEGNRLHRNMDPMVGYRKALTTWANWISANMDPRKSLVFYRTTSPKHDSPSYWYDPNGQRCYNQTDPVQVIVYRPPVPPEVPIVKQVLKKTRFPVTLLDITGMSEFRKDGHPSVYRSDFSTQQRRYPMQFADCSHWCLPGVPDTWNELLYASLIFKGFGRG